MGKRSFDLKMDRAEQHLADLQDAIRGYAHTSPYAVRVRREGKPKRNVHRLRITSDPHPSVGLVAADFVYNARSGLDHLAAALVPSSVRRNVGFPIFFQGVWEPPVQGENKERLKDRQRWATTTRKMAPGAIAVLQTLQPDDEAVHSPNPGLISTLVVLNRLSNADRHTKLPVIGAGVQAFAIRWTRPDGRPTQLGPFETGVYLNDDADLLIPEDAMDVKVEGTPLVLIRMSEPQRNVIIPDACIRILDRAREVCDSLRPYVR